MEGRSQKSVTLTIVFFEWGLICTFLCHNHHPSSSESVHGRRMPFTIWEVYFIRLLPLLLFLVPKTRALGVSSGTMLLSYIHTWIQLTEVSSPTNTRAKKHYCTASTIGQSLPLFLSQTPEHHQDVWRW